MINFTHFNQEKKHSHQYLQNCAYIQNATIIVHICTVTVALHINILLISHFAPFFSLSSPSTKSTCTSSLPHHLLLPLIHTNTPTQTNQHRNAQNLEPIISHYLTKPAKAPPPKHRSHHPPHTVQPSPPNHHHHHPLK